MLTAVPWAGAVLVGTGQTDSAVPPEQAEPSPSEVAAFVEDLNAAFPSLQARPADVRLVHYGLTPAIVRRGRAELLPDPQIIGQTTQAVLTLAVTHKLTSIALPALGTGVGHVPPNLSADAMIEAVAAHIKAGGTTLKRVIFVLYQDEAYRAFVDTLKRVGGVQ